MLILRQNRMLRDYERCDSIIALDILYSYLRRRRRINKILIIKTFNLLKNNFLDKIKNLWYNNYRK